MAAPLILSDLRGGLNDSDTAPDLRPDQVTIAENIDWDRAACGGKRRGSSPVDNGYAGLILGASFLFRHTPVNDEHYTELWMAGATVSGAVAFDYRDNTGWHAVSIPNDTIIAASGTYAIEGQSLHGKLLLAYPAESGGVPVDRLHVRDAGSSTIRRVGLRQPAVPTLATAGGSAGYTGLRYARYRYVTEDGTGLILRRSEPSESVSFTPDGTDSGMVVTRGALIGEGESHWEVELSLNDIDYYRVTTLAIATTTYTDAVAYADGYALIGTLSDDIGDYTLLWSPKFLAADEDRLLVAGAWVTPGYKSRVGWTPVGLAPGYGNDERVELDTDPYLDLDGYDGGEITAFDGPINGYMYAFKWSHTYKLIRTGNRAKAYEARNLSKQVGALPGSVVPGFDEIGHPCLYFADARRGPQRVGAYGIEDMGESVRTLWRRVNLDATIVARAVFYPDLRQYWLWVAVDGALLPNLKLIVSGKQVRRTDGGTLRGWSTHNGLSAHATAACLYAENLEDVPSSGQSLRVKPYFGLPSTLASGEAIVQQGDIGVADHGETYAARWRTKPYILGNLLQRVGVTAGAIMAEAVSGASLDVSVIRNYGSETVTGVISLTAPAGEGRVVKEIDNLSLSDLFAVQVEVGDPDNTPTSGTWAIDQVALQLRDEERS